MPDTLLFVQNEFNSSLAEITTQLEGLILAQNERWRRGLGMQVERERTFGC